MEKKFNYLLVMVIVNCFEVEIMVLNLEVENIVGVGLVMIIVEIIFRIGKLFSFE